ncbi:MAG TPA: trypsin-like serine protease [Actinospica sp.]|jgi:V8-like Glu-specific endopeptidase|nr:trypsin-like serine protease [Actinospica sp.]
MVRAGRERARRRTVGLAVAGAGVIAVGAGVLWPTVGHRGSVAGSGGGVIPIPSADASAAGSYWASRLASTAAATAPQASGSAASAFGRGTVLPNPTANGIGSSSGVGNQQAEFSAASAAPMAVSSPLTGTAFDGVAQVGAMFSTSDGSISGQGHYCTGSVVNSPEGDIVVTAAHCVYDSSGVYTDIAFVPGYHDGQDPYGVWIPSAVVVPPQWASSSDPNYDVAFLVVHEEGSGTKIQDVVGGDELGLSPSYTNLTRVIGYPESTEEPVNCTNYTSEFSDPSLVTPQLQFDCDNYPGGTSGGPFLQDVDSNTDLGTVVGVIGGYEAGGDVPNVSYSVYFADWVGSLFAQAESEG